MFDDRGGNDFGNRDGRGAMGRYDQNNSGPGKSESESKGNLRFVIANYKFVRFPDNILTLPVTELPL